MIQEVQKLDIRTLDKGGLRSSLAAWDLPRYRADQVWQWLWQKGARDFDSMSNLPHALRARLRDTFALRPITLDKEQRSLDGTIKGRFRLYDGHLIESVLIPVPEERRFTVCVSSQVGCSLSCAFCATGRMQRIRNLDASEIFDQVHWMNTVCLDTYGTRLTNIVYMGMGEPLLAYRPVLRSIGLITAEDGLHFSPRRITVSTAGIAKMIRKLADDQVRFNLALSLHAADDTKRNEIMPINAQNNLQALAQSLAYFHKRTGNKITLEYIAFHGFNDHPVDAKHLAAFCSHFPALVNLIQYNPVEGLDFTGSQPDRLDRFAGELARLGVSVTVRKSRGKDIDAACGQLANKD